MARSSNPKVKKAHVKTEFTPAQIQEFSKCMQSAEYFIHNYIYIKHPVRGLIPFALYDYQKEMVNKYQNNRMCITLASRQVGKTETICAYLLWFAIFQSKKTILIVSNKSDNAKELIDKIQSSYEELPIWMKPGVEDDGFNKHSIKFDNGSRIISEATTKNSGRGLPISLLYCDEFAFIPAQIAEAFWSSILPTLSTGGSVLISSTPNGDDNLFAELWRGAEVGANEFMSTFVPWDAPPGRDEAFKKRMIELLGLRQWQQEFECQFISTATLLLDSATVNARSAFVEKHIVPVFNLDNDLIFWKKLHRDAVYLVSVDAASGSGEDFNVINVFEFPSMIQVLEYRNNDMRPHIIYNILKKLLKFLERHTKEVYFSVENNGVGDGIITAYETDEFIPTNSHFISEAGKGNKLGFFTTEKSKLRMCLQLKKMFEAGTMVINSKITLKEMKNFVRYKGSYAAQRGSSDDSISSVLIMLRMVEEMSTYDAQAYQKLYTDDTEVGDDWIQPETDDDVMPFII